MPYIKSIPFNENTPDHLSHIPYGNDWPVVYVINNDTEAYVGETVDAVTRASQHWQNPDRRRLNEISLITDDTFNKSVILDLESFLIKHMSADGRYRLQNGNAGLRMHNYFNKSVYEKRFIEIWDKLRESTPLAQNDVTYIENSDLFKYSPYNALSSEQFHTVSQIIHELSVAVRTGRSLQAIVQGGPGTGKTILGVYMMKLISEHAVHEVTTDKNDQETDLTTDMLIEDLRLLPSMKVGFVVPMQSLRKTMKSVFASTRGLHEDMIITPGQVADKDYDLLIVDEAHRLRQRKSLNQYPPFDAMNKKLGFGDEGTELDWILKCSRNQIFFYDRFQSVKPCDIGPDRFTKLIQTETTKLFHLSTQFRCKAGNEYIKYVREVFSDDPPKERKDFQGYDFRIFDSVIDMTETIKQMDREYGLCRSVAGYAWKWVSKTETEKYDIIIGDAKYRWNATATDWINTENSVDEIGCIHTVQGYDLNYCGVIIGPEIGYDKKQGLVVFKENYFDNLGKAVGKDQDQLRDYILNIYKTLLTRGIRGTYLYVVNPSLREYLKRYF